jgi:hypothetical protein
MIMVMAFEIRRALRRRLTILILLVPAVTVIYAEVARWRGCHMCPLTPPLVTLTASLFILAQAILSDRDGRFESMIRSAPVPAWFPPARRLLLLVIPLAAQLLLCRVLFRVFGL